MGLDIYIYRASSPNLDENVVHKYEDIDGICMYEENISEAMYQQILPYAQEVMVSSKYYDIKKIAQDYSLSDEAMISCITSEYIVVWDRKSKKQVKISSQDIDEKYTKERTEKRYVVNVEEVNYWRKEYEIQEWFHDNIDCIVENVGYYVLSEELQREFNEAFPDEQIDVEAPSDESALFYHEWY